MFFCIACGENPVKTHFSRCFECLNESLDKYEDDEVIGSCDRCGTNLYAPDDVGASTCDQCLWWIEQANSDE